MNIRWSRYATFTQSAATLLGFTLGIIIIQRTGAHDATLVGVSASTIAALMPLLVTAELIKLIGASALAILASARWGNPLSPPDRPGAVLGLLAAVLLAASGCLGLYALIIGNNAMAGWVTACGLGSLALAGAFSLALTRTPSLSRPVRYLGLVYSAAAIVAPILPPISLLAALAGVVWWAGLGLNTHN